MFRRSTCRGTGLVELVVVVALGGLVMVAALDAWIWSRRSEHRVTEHADHTAQAALARAWLGRDLDRLAPELDPLPLSVAGPAPDGSVRLDLTCAGARRVRVTYAFDPAGGTLTREAGDEPVRRFALGKGSRVVMVKLDPSFAGGGPSRLGSYNNRLVFRITAGAGAQAFTLVGTAPFLVKASRDTFPFWKSSVR